ncbi:hypothetical protein [Cohnella herbarum]|uniref:VOC domain-containing protein n=1 Tax=Cohnella herbarum TaxID=2728023 RepID=A0A7Z2VHF0_9BACL|nr:hypothetical protein [Cohnella herbarum]QJD82934.1 hypothetical protein HH215_06920 [Cohnella herbarum]
MFDSYRELTDRGMKIDNVRFIPGSIWFTFKDPDGNVLTVSSPFIAKQEERQDG